jgi:hypothetical protein
MKLEIKAYSLYTAFEIFRKDVLLEVKESDRPLFLNSFVDLDKHNIEIEEVKDSLEGHGILYGYTKQKPGENANKVLVRLDNFPKEGEKKWENCYLAVWDRGDGVGLEYVADSRSKIKKECIDKARALCEEQRRNAYVIIGKSPVEFHRVETSITYIPSKGQKEGVYVFIW